MKYVWVLLLCLASFISKGQQTNPMFYKEILLTHKPYTLQSITEEIQAQSGISFSYNADNINPGTKIRIKGDRITVAEALALIKKQTGISYKIISQRHIIYTAGSGKKQPKPKKIKQRIKRPKPIAEEPEEPLLTNEPAHPSRAFRTVKTTTIKDSATDATIVVVGDSGIVADYYLGGGGSGGGGGSDETEHEEPIAKPIPERKWRRGTANRSYRSDNSGAGNKTLNYLGNNMLLATGISVDEIYYCNPTLKFGMNFIYGIASYNLGGGQNTWRYGVGGSANIDDHWSMHFVITTGQSVSKDYSIPSSSADTSIPATPLRATSKLTRYGISAHYNFGRSLAIEGGLTFNSLKTNYTSNGNPVSLSEVLPVGYDADEKYPGIKPPYTLGNSYTGSSTGNTKTWIGFQFTLLYQLRFSGE